MRYPISARKYGCADGPRPARSALGAGHGSTRGTKGKWFGCYLPMSAPGLFGMVPIRADNPHLNDFPVLYHLLLRQVSFPAIVLCDPEGRIASWNAGAERVFGWHEAEVVGQTGSLLLAPEDRTTGLFDEAVTVGRSEGTCWRVCKDGRRLFVACTVVALRDEAGTLLGFGIVMVDTAEPLLSRRESETSAPSANEKLNRLSGDLRALTANLLTVQEAERRRIARELHDDVSQRLAVLEMTLTLLQQKFYDEDVPVRADFDRLIGDVAAISDEVRSLSHRLHPSILEDLGLVPALRNLCGDFERAHGMAVHFSVHGSLAPVAMPVATVLYRIAQEALRNASKYAAQATVTVTLQAEFSGIRLRVEDTGPGIDARTLVSKTCLGFISMQERAKLVGGTFVVTSQPNQGTTVEVYVPLSTTEE